MNNPHVREWLTREGGLAAQLKAARISAGLTGHGLGDILGWGQAKVSKLENGRQMPTVEQVRDWGRACKLKRAEVRGLEALADEGRSVYLHWRQRITTQVDHQGDYNRLTADSTDIVHFDTSLVCGILQTVDYARAVLAIWDEQLGRDRDPDDIADAALVRFKRAEHLYDPAKTFRLLMTQDVLTSWRYLDGAGMAAQWDRVVMLAQLPTVDVRVIPNGARQPLDLAVCESFGMWDGTLVTSEAWWGEPVYEDETKVIDYRKAVDLLTDVALDPEESLALIRQAADRERAAVG